jgi:hypothetical protein
MPTPSPLLFRIAEHGLSLPKTLYALTGLTIWPIMISALADLLAGET